MRDKQDIPNYPEKLPGYTNPENRQSLKNVPEDEAIDELLGIIEADRASGNSVL